MGGLCLNENKAKMLTEAHFWNTTQVEFPIRQRHIDVLKTSSAYTAPNRPQNSGNSLHVPHKHYYIETDLLLSENIKGQDIS